MSTQSVQQIEGEWPIRSESVMWRVYDVDLNILGQLMVSGDATPRITNDTGRPVRRTVDNLQVLPRPPYDQNVRHFYSDDIDTLTLRVRPFWTFADGTEYPMGIFVFGSDSRDLWSWGEPMQCTLTDLTTNLDQPLTAAVGYPPGASVFNALNEQATLEGFDTEHRTIDPTDATFAEAVGWVAGRDTRLVVLESLCKIAGFLPAYLNNDGLLVCRTTPDLTTSTPSYYYDPGQPVVPGSVILSTDKLTAPNQYIVISSNADVAIVGIYDVPDVAPNSYENTHLYRRKTIDIQGLTTTEQAVSAAATAYVTDAAAYTWLSFDSTVDPRQDTWDVVSFGSVNYLQLSTSIEMKAGGTMRHETRGAYFS